MATTQWEMAPELMVSTWLNSKPMTLEQLRGKVVVIEAFQMLCPGCVSIGLPQAQRVRDTFHVNDVEVIGLHTVFEHHEAQGSKEALEAFLHEYKIQFPVAIDKASTTHAIPKTMAAYETQGTPSMILIDRLGHLRAKHFGNIADISLGAQIMQLALEAIPPSDSSSDLSSKHHAKHDSHINTSGCSDDGCSI